MFTIKATELVTRTTRFSSCSLMQLSTLTSCDVSACLTHTITTLYSATLYVWKGPYLPPCSASTVQKAANAILGDLSTLTAARVRRRTKPMAGVDSKTLCCHILPSDSCVQPRTIQHMEAASAAFGVVDINTELHDGGCAGDQTHSLRPAAAAAAAGHCGCSS